MDDRPHWLDQPRNVKLLWRGFLVVMALAILAELIVTLHPHFAIESYFGFNAWFGLLVCALLGLVSKAISVLLKRPETYYGKDHD